MSLTTDMIMQWGGFIVIAFFFLIVLRWMMSQFTCMKESHEKAVEGFIETANDFNTTVSNCMTTQAEEFRRQGEQVQRLSETLNRLAEKL